ncbi:MULTISPECIES: phage tail assembly protein [unclassified Pseudomonas]|uniref:phage tail assembly protein n=1 Tax=unclassified Pseudomonas TaxID=196821 RepID=UPI000D94B5A5|nr:MULTISPECIES: phage tail assembly protein [unclassified Pseudomonas]PYG83232.1 tail assembly chaperone E/41/14-like protein [Pseudomonas sp. RV120224-01c]PYG86428.1 tail assembly chaperone E/41/14-like protein [Pseudomonas sp. RV120224-01b]
MSKPAPKYLKLTAESVTVTLAKPTEMNGIKVDTITLRAPTVRDMRISSQTSDGDDEQRELNLFASLAEVGVKDLEGLTYKDYNRVSTGYTFLVREDEL